MKVKTIHHIMDLLDLANNQLLDLEYDLKNSELVYMYDSIRVEIIIAKERVKELKGCIKWLKSLK